MMLEFVFWFSSAVLLYTYFGYPLFLWIAGIFLNNPVTKGEITPSVTIVIAVYNEEKYIENKLLNCLALDYPREKREILVGSDGSNDRTNEIVKCYASQGVVLHELRAREGKISVLNYLVPRAKGEIILFADARQVFEMNVVRELVRNFNDEEVGCVSGELMLKKSDETPIATGMGLYWNYEKSIRKGESRIGSMIGATGAIYAIRKKLYKPQSKEIILDDVFIPMEVVKQGYRAVFETQAIAYDEASKTTAAETQRKIRTLAGNWQILMKMGRVLDPSNGNIAFQLLSHKISRIMIPYFLIALFISSIFLEGILFKTVLFLQVFFYLFATAGIPRFRMKTQMFSVPYTFCVLNLSAVKGFFAFISHQQQVTWEK